MNQKIIIILAFIFGQSLTSIGQDFITKWSFTSAASQIRFNALTTGVVNYTWSASPSGNSGSGSFTQTSAGTVTLSGLSIPANNVVTLNMSPVNLRRFYIIYGPDKNKLTDVLQWGAVPWSSMERAFAGCSNLIISATDIPNLSNVNTMYEMFSGASSVNQDIGNWNTTNVGDMSGMFFNATSFNQNIGNWNTYNVFTMQGMFQNATSFNQNIGIWNTFNLFNSGSMFYNATSFNQDIGNWNVSHASRMQGMFQNATSFNQNIGNWNTSNVTDISQMFEGATSFNQDISNWNTSKVEYMSYTFFNASSFNQNLGNWTLHSNSNLYRMLNNSGMDCDHYSETLIGWSNNPAIPSGRNLGALGRLYGTNAVTARNNLINNKGWTITGDGPSGTACNLILPVNLLDFSCRPSLDGNLVKWTTVSEINNSHFIIEHSLDGRFFEELGKVQGQGNFSEKNDYSFVHEKPTQGIHYYRLKQIDFDGQYSYSDIVSVDVRSMTDGISIYPNPTKDLVNVVGIENGSYTILDPMGREMRNGILVDGSIPLDGLTKGMYVVKIVSEFQVFSKVVLKE